jgi:Arc/MetJ-type ribon-helix-helix transcriptional regulator
MAELITLKLEANFLEEVDSTVKKNGFSSRTDFIRAALREKMEKIKLREDLAAIRTNWGKSKRKTTDEEIHAVREKVFNEFAKKLGVQI